MAMAPFELAFLTEPPMRQPLRPLLITLLLMVAGGLLGGLAYLVGAAGALAIEIGLPLSLADGLTLLRMGSNWWTDGLRTGAVVAPAVAWLWLRHVSLWRALVFPAVGAVVGLWISHLIGLSPDVIGEIAGALCAIGVAQALAGRRDGDPTTTVRPLVADEGGEPLGELLSGGTAGAFEDLRVRSWPAPPTR